MMWKIDKSQSAGCLATRLNLKEIESLTFKTTQYKKEE